MEWPSWRGPHGNAVAPAGEYPAEISDATKAWETPLPGEGTSTPVEWGGAIFLTASDDGSDLVCCYSQEGELQWRVALPGGEGGKHKSATGSNPSAVCNADYVVAYFKSGNIVCLTHDGDELWRKNLQEEYGDDSLWWDLGTSPVLTSAGVAVAVIQEKNAYLVTLDLKSGQEVWRADRHYARPRESDQAYTTPAVISEDGRETIVTWGADHLTGHDAQSGKLLWECGGFNPENQGMWRVIASATVADGVAYVPYGRGDYFAAVRVTGPADATQEERWLWNATRVGADVPSPVINDNRIYNLEDRGTLSCLDAKSGEVLWSERLPRSNRKYYSSPLLAGGRLYCAREDGAVFVVSVKDGFELISEGDLGGEIVATPTPTRDGVLFRTRSKLLRFDGQSGG